MLLLKNLYLSTKPFFREYLHGSHVSQVVLNQKISISLDQSFVYYRIPKAANSTIFNTLYENVSGRRVGSMEELSRLKERYFSRPSDIRRKEIRRLANFCHFTFVRHPVKRFFSCYRDKILGEEKSEHVNKLMRRPLHKKISLEDFVSYLENGGLYQNAHWAPQTHLLPSDLKTLSFIGKVESIEEDWTRLSRMLGVEWQLSYFAPHSTSKKISHGDSSGLDDVVVRRVEALYQKDLEELGY